MHPDIPHRCLYDVCGIGPRRRHGTEKLCGLWFPSFRAVHVREVGLWLGKQRAGVHRYRYRTAGADAAVDIRSEVEVEGKGESSRLIVAGVQGPYPGMKRHAVLQNGCFGLITANTQSCHLVQLSVMSKNELDSMLEGDVT